jgi:hypothetical protein
MSETFIVVLLTVASNVLVDQPFAGLDPLHRTYPAEPASTAVEVVVAVVEGVGSRETVLDILAGQPSRGSYPNQYSDVLVILAAVYLFATELFEVQAQILVIVISPVSPRAVISEALDGRNQLCHASSPRLGQ